MFFSRLIRLLGTSPPIPGDSPTVTFFEIPYLTPKCLNVSIDNQLQAPGVYSYCMLRLGPHSKHHVTHVTGLTSLGLSLIPVPQGQSCGVNGAYLPLAPFSSFRYSYKQFESMNGREVYHRFLVGPHA